MSKLRAFLRRAWSSACMDQPYKNSCTVINGRFHFSIKGNEDKLALYCKESGIPSHAEFTQSGDTSLYRWESVADTIFDAGGLLDQALPSYEVRLPQLHMARLVQRAIEMNDNALVEAGTGTGKSFAYAAVAMAMNKRVVISTSNKALQMQLYKKDIPFLQGIFPGKQVALVQGKRNYACRRNCEDLNETSISDPKLLRWYHTTETGNTEEITFYSEETKAITVDDTCEGKRCGHFDNCFYYDAKAQREDADVLITNHAMLALDQALPFANILPPCDLIVVDEAHQLTQYVRNALENRLNMTTLRNRKELLSRHGVPIDTYAFTHEIQSLIGRSADNQIGIPTNEIIESGITLANEMRQGANYIWLEKDVPTDQREIKLSNDARKIRNSAMIIREFSEKTRAESVRWIDNGDQVAVVISPHDVSEFIGGMAGYHTIKAIDPAVCSVCENPLTGDSLYVSSLKQPCCPLCINDFDPLMWDCHIVSMAEWLETPHHDKTVENAEFRTPMVFCSATIANPDFAHFKLETGIPDGLEMIAKSPFDYASNALIYIPNGNAPSPKQRDAHLAYMVEELSMLVSASGGGALLLFTSYSSMNYCHTALASEFELSGKSVLKQGELPKRELGLRLENSDNGVLFATKSFFEGISIEGDALRLVCIEKMPFGALTPINSARDDSLREYAAMQGIRGSELEFYPFNKRAVPEMIIELKQGAGRLVRTGSDKGVIAILDSRLRTTRYGRQQAMPSLPPAPITDRHFMVSDFYNEYRAPATSMEVFGLMADPETPF